MSVSLLAAEISTITDSCHWQTATFFSVRIEDSYWLDPSSIDYDYIFR
jgi:hypothetical protein